MAGQAQLAYSTRRVALTSDAGPAAHLQGTGIAQGAPHPQDDGGHIRMVRGQCVRAREQMFGQLAQHAAVGEDRGQDHLDPLFWYLGLEASNVARHVGLRAGPA
jgi:hypothetical protein